MFVNKDTTEHKHTFRNVAYAQRVDHKAVRAKITAEGTVYLGDGSYSGPSSPHYILARVCDCGKKVPYDLISKERLNEAQEKLRRDNEHNERAAGEGVQPEKQ